jgi:phosphohistidine phosphatase
MNLFLLRHGIAVERGTPGYERDADRPLTPKGERRLGRIADAMDALGLKFDLILSSPYARARQTAEIVADALGLKKKLEFSESLTPDGDARALIAALNKLEPQPENVLLVGHEPFLSDLISMLTSGDAHVTIDFKKGGLCKLEIETLRHGRCATLAWLLTPRQMGLMA